MLTLKVQDQNYEAHLSTLCCSPQAHPWVSCTHEVKRRPGSDPGASCQGPQASRCLSFTMGKRDDRLRDPAVFRQALMKRPVARAGAFSIYRAQAPSLSGRLGFVIPKKLVRTAVQRNQIKRWARAIFRGFETSQAPTGSWVVRVSQPLSKESWRLTGRLRSKQDLGQAMKNAIQK